MEQFNERIDREINEQLKFKYVEWGEVIMHSDKDPFIRNLNELIQVLQVLVKEHPEAGNVGVQVLEEWEACDECSDQQLANHCVDFKTQIIYNPTGSHGHERSGCVIIRGGE